MESMLLENVEGAEVVRYNNGETCMVLVRESGLLIRERRTEIDVFIPKGTDWDQVVSISKPDEITPQAKMSWSSGKSLTVENAEWFGKAITKATKLFKQLS